MRCSKPILLLLFVLMAHKGFSQLSKIHYIPPLTSGEPNADPQDQWIYISTPSVGLVPYTITQVGGADITGTVSNAAPATINIGNGYDTQLFQNSENSSTITNNKGFIIEAEASVYVSVRMNAGGAQAGALVSKGASAPDTRFRIGTYTSENPSGNYVNFLSVMATADNTAVNFSNLKPGITIENFTGTTPINITLNEGESYVIAIKGNANSGALMDGLIGTLVESDKPIVVNCGSANGSMSNGGGRDYGIDQIAGASKIGNEYIFVRGDGDDDWENIVVVADTDNTAITINNNTTPIATINAGEYFVIEGNNYSINGNMYVETSENVFMYQGIGSLNAGIPNEANQGMFFVPPLSCETRGNINNIANIENIGGLTFSGGVTIVTRLNADVSINGNNLTNPSTVLGNTDYVTYRVTGLNGNVTVEGDDELYVAYFNANGFATSGGFYSGFPSPPEINFDVQFAALGNCIPNVTLEAANASSFDSFDWLYDDGSGSGFVSLNLNQSTITPTLPGKYKLVGIITCTLETLESVEIPVSICPDDRDNDGIIDNIDIDNDNDGIENCDESNGNILVNLNDVNNPTSVFENDPLTSPPLAITSSGDTVNINGDTTGNFTSSLGSTVMTPSEYTLNFNESINIKFTAHNTIVNTIGVDEFFIARIAPSNKNITLLDPDDQLLVDSNFDGVFETGITQISGSEIHFKINPTPTGNAPYEFLANQVDGFSLIHTPATTNVASTFSGNISLTCYKKDHDGDGIKDEFDLDSDNDGIPDSVENNGTLVPLSGVDANNDGLDDMYNTFAPPIDTDNDGIIDIFDLDSDNDGIYDVTESGLPATVDTDLDGIIDVSFTFGINGWADTAESAPDSNTIGYTLNDLDTDTVFSYTDDDSDGDSCSDVIEAGFSDGNTDNYLGDTPPTVNTNGVVNNASDGYTVPNAAYLDIAPISIDSQTTAEVVCENANITINLVSSNADTIQWEISNDNGVSWTNVLDNATFSGSNTFNLTITSTPLTINSATFRAFLNRTGNACGLYSADVTITVNPAPVIASTVNLVQCDDEDISTLGFSAFNLNEANDEISTNAANETFTYFLTQAAATLGDQTSPDFINAPTTFTNRTINTDIVWARIESQDGCVSTSEIQLSVSSTAIPSTFLATLYQCDDFLDINGNNTTNNDNRDGIATFDFSSVTSNILSFIPAGQNPLPPRYFRNEIDALAEENEITDISNYRNIGYPGSQFIYVRVDSNTANDCLGLGAHVELIVEALPVANSVTIPAACDDDTTDAIIAHAFDTSTIEADILNGQSLTDVNITYSYNDITGNPVVSNTLPNPFLTETQDVTITVSNANSLALDGPCDDEIAVSFVVHEQPVIAAAIPDQVFCDGQAGDIDNDGIYPFDTTTFANTVLGTQVGTMTIYFDYIDADGITQTDETTLPNTLQSANQTINVRVENPLNPSCFAATQITLQVNPLPEFSVDSPRIVCSSNPAFQLDLEPIETDASEIFDYEWQWTNLDGSISNQFVSNNRNITVSEPGTYSITLSKTDGTGCFRTRDVIVDASELATITLNDVTIVDISENNSVTIDPSGLGMGDYEYALVPEDSNTINYQDDTVFSNVRPGFYTLYVNDAICGAVTLPIAVIGAPRYFTPNGDTINDFWNIKGISESAQASSVIRIYNRYGKLLKQIFPSSTQGWDGTFNGRLMPTDDYWFNVALEDGRNFMGHFTLKR